MDWEDVLSAATGAAIVVPRGTVRTLIGSLFKAVSRGNGLVIFVSIENAVLFIFNGGIQFYYINEGCLRTA